jgi:uncharacterized protein YuzE
MVRYFTIGENTFIEIDENNNIFSFRFRENKLSVLYSFSREILALAEETNKWNYKKELENRIKYFNKTFK